MGGWAWAAIGTGVAVILALIVFMGVGVFANSSSPPTTDAAASTSTTAPAASSTTRPQATTSTTRPPTTTAPAGGIYRDPAGIYTMNTAATWRKSPRSLASVPIWNVAPVSSPQSNLAVATQPLDYATSLSQLVLQTEEAVSVRSTAQLVWDQPATLDDGTLAELVRYTINQAGGQVEVELMLTVDSEHAAVITVTAPVSDAARVFAQVDPYLRSFHLL
jgi:hypothetical protein